MGETGFHGVGASSSELMNLPKGKEYWSCNWLEGGLAFLDDRVTACCAEGAPVYEIATDSGVSIERILQCRKEIVDAVNSSIMSHRVCGKCQFLCKKMWDKKEYLFDFITIATSTLCNLRCIFCDIVKREHSYTTYWSKYVPCAPFFRHVISEGFLSPYATVNISGGEPVLFPEFEDLIDLLNPNVGQLRIFSNGTIFSEAILRALRNPNTSLIVSLDASDPEIYKRIKGKDLCDRAWENAARYANVGGDRVFAKMIITEDNLGDISGFVKRANDNKIVNLYYDLDKNKTLVDRLFPEDVTRYSHAIAQFKLECLKRQILYSNAQAGCTQVIENASHDVLSLKAEESGVCVRTCALGRKSESFRAGDLVQLWVDVTGYDISDLQFKFFVKFENLDWMEIQSYHSDNTCNWVPDRQGMYLVCAYIRYRNSSQPFTDSCTIEVSIS